MKDRHHPRKDGLEGSIPPGLARIAGHGETDFHVFERWDLPDRFPERLRFHTLDEIVRLLSTTAHDPQIQVTFRSLLARSAEWGHLPDRLLSDHELWRYVADLVWSDEVWILEVATRRGAREETEPEESEERVTPVEPTDTNWIEIVVVHDRTDKPIANVRVPLTLPDGKRVDLITDPEGWVEAAGLPEGSCGCDDLVVPPGVSLAEKRRGERLAPSSP